MSRARPLPILDAEIDERVRATRDAHPYWPCSKGCDLCCRSLPFLPVMTGEEWGRVRDALLALPDAERADVVDRTRRAPERGPLACPILDEAKGACRIYQARPIACRTYGFYTERDAGLHCERVTRAIEEHANDEPILWGNGEAIHHRMHDLGEPVSLRTWLEHLAQTD
ncbi:MAG: YkgJ family cysteine cluster protein [Polyangiaceae bacterium]|nr:YkgJ family cysteine cluster protein [Polyangiaceae bacterium]